MSTHDKVYENMVKAFTQSGHHFLEAEEGIKTVEAIEKIYNNRLAL